MKLVPHVVNERLRGNFVELDDGRKIYIAHRKMRDAVRPKQAWVIEESILRRCQEQGVNIVAVVTRQSGKRVFYAAPASDFYGPDSFSHLKTCVGRALPALSFPINPATRPDVVERIATIG